MKFTKFLSLFIIINMILMIPVPVFADVGERVIANVGWASDYCPSVQIVNKDGEVYVKYSISGIPKTHKFEDDVLDWNLYAIEVIADWIWFTDNTKFFIGNNKTYKNVDISNGSTVMYLKLPRSNFEGKTIRSIGDYYDPNRKAIYMYYSRDGLEQLAVNNFYGNYINLVANSSWWNERAKATIIQPINGLWNN